VVADVGDVRGAGGGRPPDPAKFGEPVEQATTECSGEVVTPFALVDAVADERPPRRPVYSVSLGGDQHAEGCVGVLGRLARLAAIEKTGPG
jgi:hypothetical protein